MGFESGPKNEVPEQETQENQAKKEQCLEAHNAAMTLRTLTEGGFERSEAARKILTALIETPGAGKDSDLIVPVSRAIEAIPESGRGTELTDEARKIMNDAWTAVNEYIDKNGLN